MSDPNSGVYSTGRDRFSKTLLGNDRALLSSTPLEGAYTWVLSTRAKMEGILHLGREFRISCQKLSPGRLFDKSFREDFEPLYNALEQNTIYYALEGPGSGYTQDHPLCDLYFKTTNNELVAIDITAFNDAEYVTSKPNKLPILTKRSRMIAWVKTWSEKYNSMGVTLHGVVLAPFNSRTFKESELGDNSVTILQGDDAVRHLGGLSQFLFWFLPKGKVDIDAGTEEEEKPEAKKMRGLAE